MIAYDGVGLVIEVHLRASCQRELMGLLRVPIGHSVQARYSQIIYGGIYMIRSQ
jgi:hypothetical protein